MESDGQSEKALSHFSQTFYENSQRLNLKQKRQTSHGMLLSQKDLDEEMKLIKLSLINQQKITRARGNQLADALNNRKNFNSAKARLNNIGGSPESERYLVDPVYSNKGVEQIASDLGQQIQRERIEQAVKKPRDVFGSAIMDNKPVQVAKYVLGKNQRPKNPARTRIVPSNLPKAGNKSKTMQVKQSNQSPKPANPMQQLQSKTMVATGAAKKNATLQKSSSVPNGNFKTVGSLQNNRRNKTGASLPRIRNNSNAEGQQIEQEKRIVGNDLEGVISPEISVDMQPNAALQKAAADKKKSKDSSAQYLHDEVLLDMNVLRQQHNVNDLQDKRHVETILDKAYTSAQKNLQSNLYEAIVNANSSPANETLVPWDVTAESANQDKSSSNQPDETQHLEQIPHSFITSVQTIPKVSMTAKRLAGIFNSSSLTPKSVLINEMVQQADTLANQMGNNNDKAQQISKPPIGGSKPAFRIKDSLLTSANSIPPEMLRHRHATPQNIRSSSGSDFAIGGTNVMKQFGFMMNTASDNKNEMNVAYFGTDEPQQQAFITESQTADGQPPQQNQSTALVQAKKLAIILNKAISHEQAKTEEGAALPPTKKPNLVKSASVPVMRKDLKQIAAAMYSQPSGVQTDIAPKEFLMKVQSELRRESQKKMEGIKQTHKESFDQMQECGIVQQSPTRNNIQAQNRTGSRYNTPFTQNVRSMNFFSVFVNKSVDGQIEVENLASQTSGQLRPIENMNKDDKEMTTALTEPRTSFKQEVAMMAQEWAPPNMENQAAPGDQTCKCNSLTNEMIQALVLDSPIKDLVESVHSYQFFHQNHNKAAGTNKNNPVTAVGVQVPVDPLKKALEDQFGSGVAKTLSGGSYAINERTDVAVLNILLNQILTGKFTYDKSQIFKEIGDKKDGSGRPSWTQILDRFLKGINLKGMLGEIQQKILKKQEGVLDILEESEDDDDEDERKDFFFLNTIKEKELALAELLETRKLPEKKKFVAGEAATFLTQVYKESELTQKELEEKFPNWAKARNIQKVSQDIINSHAASKENVASQKRLNDKKLKKEKEVKHLFDQIHNIAQEAEATAIDFFRDQTTLSQAEQANNAGKEQLLYLCFLEIVRQVSGQCKEQALFLVKLWHAYFDHFQNQMKRTLSKISGQTNKISDLLDTMTKKFSKVLVIDESKDVEFLALIDKHDKALQLLELVSKSLYQERQHTNRLTLELDTLKDNFTDILPNYEKYYSNQEFRKRLMEYSILEKTDAWSQSERQQQHMTPAIRKIMEEQMERDPKQAPIIKDIYRIQSVCTMRMPVDYALENAKEAFQKSAIALKMKEIYYKNLQERAQRLKRQNEELIKRIQDQQEHHELQLIQKEFEAKERIQAAVKMFRQQQLKNILSEPKEVQTDHELIEKYFTDLENQKELGIRAMMISRKLTSVQMQQLRVMKAFEKTPKYKHLTKPIVHIMRTVRDDQSKLPAKTLKKTLEIVSEIIQERLNLVNAPTDNFKIDLLNLEHFYAKFMYQKYGIDNLAQKYTEQWLVSIKAHANRDPRVSLFMRFLGLGGYHSLPFSVFRYYLHLLKATNVQVEEVFKNTDPASITLSYQKVMKGYRSLIEKTNIFNRRNIMTQLRHNSKINANNPVILRDLSFSMFETYRYLVERVLKSTKYRSFSELLNQLYEQHSHYMENQEHRGSIRKKRQLRKTKTMAVSGFGRTSTVDSEKLTTLVDVVNESVLEENNKSKQLDESKIFETPKQEKETSQLDVIAEDKDLNDLLDSNAKKDQVKNNEFGDIETGFKVRAVDAADEEKDYVRLSSLIKFFADQLGMTRKTDHQRLKDMFEVILVKAQCANPERIGRFQALRCFTEKIEIAVPMDVYFHIGINAEIDHENSENMWLEKVFNFYSQLMPDKYKASSGMDPDHRLVFSGEHAYDGLEFVQFYIFVKDGGSKMGKDKIKIYQVYEDELKQKSRQRLSCDDFIELIRKFNLIKTKLAFENQMRMRYEQAKNRDVHLETQERATQIARFDPDLHQISPEITPVAASRNITHPHTEKKMNEKIVRHFNTDLLDSGVQDQSMLQNIDNAKLGSNAPRLQLLEGSSSNNNQLTKKEQDSFERRFENTKTPYRSKDGYSQVNLQTQPNSRLSVLSKRKNDPDSETTTNQQAQQFVLVPNQDGELQMSPQPHLGPSMLEMAHETGQSAAGSSKGFVNFKATFKEEDKQTSWPDNEEKKDAATDTKQKTKEEAASKMQAMAQNTQTTFGRPPSPIMPTPDDHSRIVDKEVADTIARINFIQQQKAPIKELLSSHTSGGIRVRGNPRKSGSKVKRAALDTDGSNDDDGKNSSDNNLIEAAIETLNWQEGSSLQVPDKSEEIVLSRADTFQAHAIEKVDLLGYKLNYSPDRSVVQERPDAEQEEASAQKKGPDEDHQGLGFLELMFGSDNMKLKDLNHEAKQYVEAEQARIIDKVKTTNFIQKAPKLKDLVNGSHAGSSKLIPQVDISEQDQKSSEGAGKQQKNDGGTCSSDLANNDDERLEVDPSHNSSVPLGSLTTDRMYQQPEEEEKEVKDVGIEEAKTLILSDIPYNQALYMTQSTQQLKTQSTQQLKTQTTQQLKKSQSVQQPPFHKSSLSNPVLRRDNTNETTSKDFKSYHQVSQMVMEEARSPTKIKSPMKLKKKLNQGPLTSGGISEWHNKQTERSIANIVIVPDKDIPKYHIEETKHGIDDAKTVNSKYQEVESRRAKSSRHHSRIYDQNDKTSSPSLLKKKKTVVKKKKKKSKAAGGAASMQQPGLKKQKTGTNDDIEGVLVSRVRTPIQNSENVSSLSADDAGDAGEKKDQSMYQSENQSKIHLKLSTIDDRSFENIEDIIQKKSSSKIESKKVISRNQISPEKFKSSNNALEMSPVLVPQSESKIVKDSIDELKMIPKLQEEVARYLDHEMSQFALEEEKRSILPSSIQHQASTPDYKQADAEEEEKDWDHRKNTSLSPPPGYNFGNAEPPQPPLSKKQLREQKKKKIEQLLLRQQEQEQLKIFEEKRRNALFAKRTYAEDEDDWIFGNGNDDEEEDDTANGAPFVP